MGPPAADPIARIPLLRHDVAHVRVCVEGGGSGSVCVGVHAACRKTSSAQIVEKRNGAVLCLRVVPPPRPAAPGDPGRLP